MFRSHLFTALQFMLEYTIRYNKQGQQAAWTELIPSRPLFAVYLKNFLLTKALLASMRLALLPAEECGWNKF